MMAEAAFRFYDTDSNARILPECVSLPKIEFEISVVFCGKESGIYCKSA